MTAAVTDPSVQAVLHPVLAPAADAAQLAGARLILGVGTPGAPLAEPDMPLVVIPALGPGHPHAWEADRLGRMAAIGLLDRSEALFLRDEHPDAPVVLLGMPAPARRAATHGLDMGDAPDHMDLAWAEELGDVPADGPGVTWIQGAGAVPVARALIAWAEGRAVVALPGTMRHPLLRSGGVLYADGPLDAIEATVFLRENAALVASLASRGRRASCAQPSPGTWRARADEAIALALDGRGR